MQENILKVMLKSKQTVFSFKELLLLLKTNDVTALKSTLNYYIKNGELYHIRRGLYAKDANYDRLELATKIFTPSYVSFETILFSAGIIFQYYSAIFVASYQSREINCDGQAFVFKRIKPTILTNSKGVENNVAIPERGLLDLLYLNKEYHFDNLEPIDWDRVYEILPIYKNKSLEQRLIALPNSWKKSIEE